MDRIPGPNGARRPAHILTNGLIERFALQAQQPHHIVLGYHAAGPTETLDNNAINVVVIHGPDHLIQRLVLGKGQDLIDHHLADGFEFGETLGPQITEKIGFGGNTGQAGLIINHDQVVDIVLDQQLVGLVVVHIHRCGHRLGAHDVPHTELTPVVIVSLAQQITPGNQANGLAAVDHGHAAQRITRHALEGRARRIPRHRADDGGMDNVS